MTHRFTCTARVEPDGTLRAKLPEKWGAMRVLVTVEDAGRPLKTLEQLAYFHGPIVKHWSEHTGYELDEMKAELKKWLPPQSASERLTGDDPGNVDSLTYVSLEDMTVLIDRCLKEGALLGIEFPTPPWKKR